MYLDENNKNKIVKIRLNLAETNYLIHIPQDYYLEQQVQKIPSREYRKSFDAWEVPVSCSDDVFALAAYCIQYGYNLQSETNLFQKYHEFNEKLFECYKAVSLTDLPPEVAELNNLYKSNREPFEHQRVAFCTMLYGFGYLNNYMLFDEMGLGKTKSVIDVHNFLLEQKLIERVVIVCPATLKRVWAEEIELNTDYRFEKMEIVIIGGNATKRGDMEHAIAAGNLRKKVKWVIINYESSWRSEYFPRLCEGAGLVADEAHKLKSKKAKQTQGFERIKGLAKKITILTGTPIVNNPNDLYTITEKVKPGSLGHNEFRFAQLFSNVRETQWGNVVDGYKNVRDARNRTSRFSIRRLKEDCLNLPDKIFEKRHVELTKDQSDHYIKIVNELQTYLTDNKGNSVDVIIKAAIAMLMRLQQVCDGYISSGMQLAHFENGGAKYIVLDDIIEELVDKSEKQLVIWTRFVPPIKFMKERYAKFKPALVYGAISSVEGEDGFSDRDKEINRFKDGDARLFIAQTHTAGLGITLTNASHEVMFDRWWSPAVNMQAIDRCHRIGQKNTVIINDIITTASAEMIKKISPEIQTMDEIVQMINQRKEKLSADFIDNEEKVEMADILAAAGLK